MKTNRLAGTLAKVQEQAIRKSDSLNEYTHGWSRILAEAIRETLKPDSAVHAAAIAYFAIFSLFPLTLLSISIASLQISTLMDQNMIVQKLEFIAPALGLLLGENISEVILARGPVTILASIGLIWTASTFFYILTNTLNGIWGIKKRRSFWKRRGLAILFVLAFVGPALLLASFASSTVANLQPWLPDQIIPVKGFSGFMVALLLDVALFMVLFILLPHGAASWREILPGAIGAGLLWEFAKKAFLLYVSTYLSVSNLVYGSVAAIIAFLVWAYVSGMIFLFGAFISVSYYKKKTATQSIN